MNLDRQLMAAEVTTKSGTLEVGAVRSLFASTRQDLRYSMSRRTDSASCASLSPSRNRLGRSR